MSELDDTAVGTDELWHRLAAELRRYLRAQLGDPELAEDVLQDVFLKLHDQPERLRSIAKLDAWVLRVARNAAIDQLRRRRTVALDEAGELVEAPRDDPHERDASRVIAAWLRSRVEQLPQHYREALELVEVQGLSQRAAAEQLGIGYSTLKSRVQRGRDLLHADLLRCCEVELDARHRVTDFRTRQATPCACAPCTPSGTNEPNSE